MNNPYVTVEMARKVLEVVDAGLVRGVGNPLPGQMCVEAAVCYAMGLPHSDRPSCVGAAVRAYKIRLNDAGWSSNEARTKGLRLLAIAQLGSDSIDQKAFARIVTEQAIRQVVPIAIRAAASRIPGHAQALEEAAIRCEKEGTGASAVNARDIAQVAATADADDADDAYAAYAAATAASDAYAATAYAAGAYYAYAAAAAAANIKIDDILNLSCKIGLDALIELKSPGCEFLYLAGYEL